MPMLPHHCMPLIASGEAGGALWAAALLLIAGGLLLGYPVVARRLGGGRGRGSARPLTLEERAAKAEAIAREREAVEAAARDAREVIRLGCAQLDARIERLETLLAMADERLGSSGEEGPGEQPSEAPAPVAVRTVRVGPALTGGVPGAPGEPVDPSVRRICELAEAGRSAQEIARELHEHRGKVELVLALHRRSPGVAC